MKISSRTLSEVGRLITGDGGRTPYRTKNGIMRFFESISVSAEHIQGDPSRWHFAEQCLSQVNDTPAMARAIEEALHPASFIGSEFNCSNAVEFLNQYLIYDGYSVTTYRGLSRVQQLDGKQVSVKLQFSNAEAASQAYVDEQIAKCERKLDDGDFDGAITNARTLLEAILLEMEREFNTDVKSYDGDLGKLYKRVQSVLGLDAGRKDVSDTVKQILSGLSSIISGIAGLRNKMSDAHALSYRPARHHAVLAINASKTICNFFLETRSYQLNRGVLKRRDSLESGS